MKMPIFVVGSTGSALGTAIGFGGDINGDGSDVVVSAPFGDVHNVTGAGKILLWNSESVLQMRMEMDSCLG